MSGVKGLSQPEAKRVPVGLEKSLVASFDCHANTSIREPNWARQESQWLHAGPSTASEPPLQSTWSPQCAEAEPTA